MTNEAYHDLLERGAFPDQIDPWAEEPRYFQQLHSSMIQQIVNQIRRPLGDRGYFVAKETSLQVYSAVEPNFPSQRIDQLPRVQDWDYVAVGAALMLDTGIELDVKEPERITIRRQMDGALVTVLEIISTGSKAEYHTRRRELVTYLRVNVVEIDLIRSAERHYKHDAIQHPYNVIIYLPNQEPLFIGSAFVQPLKKFLLPLRIEGIMVNPQLAYENAYRETGIAQQIDIEGGYTLDNLKFPSLISAGEKHVLMQALDEWRVQLAALKASA